jgi:anti-anti-sigma factor
MDLEIAIEKNSEGNSLTVLLIGSLDTKTYLEFEKKTTAALEPAIKGIILDMAGLTYISSMGFSAIFRVKQAIERSGGKIVLANLQPNIKRVFDSVKVIPEAIFATLEEADEYLDKFIAFVNSKEEKKE